MNLLSISISHHTAPVELREALYLNSDEIKILSERAKGTLFKEGFIISTCNRTEVFGIPFNKEITNKDIEKFVLDFKPVSEIKPEHFKHFNSESAVEHLFKVITGIDSLLIGDNQIYQQVRDAFKKAEDIHFVGFLVKRLFDAAAKTGKRAINETEISEGAVTVSFAAVQLVEKIFSNLGKKSALVIGAGETGEIAAKHLSERGIGRLAITNRTIEKAERLAEKLNAKIIPFTNFKDYLQDYDIILSATSSDSLILTREEVKAAMKKRSNAATVLMDIAIPRDIDPRAKSIDNVFYQDIDSLNIIVDQNLSKRKEEIPKVEKIINEEVTNFFSWYNSLEVAPTIKNLRQHFEMIRAEEVGKNINRFNEDEREKVEIVTKRIINKILHHPTVELRKISDAGLDSDEAVVKISALKEIFGFDNKKEEDK